MLQSKLLLIIVVVLGMLFSGIGFSESLAMAAAPDKGGKVAADFTLETLDGNSVTFSDLKGKKAALVVFWTTWCPYCVQEVPELNKLQEKLGDKGLEILAIDIKESKNKLDSFVKKQGVKYKVLLDKDGSVAQKYNVYGIPANFLIDKQGLIRATGSLPKESLIEEVVNE